MDLKARSKAANIIFSILILLLIFLPVLGFIPFPKDSLSFLTFSELRLNGELMSKDYLIDQWKLFFDLVKNFGDAYGSAPAAACGSLLYYGSFAFATFGCGIFYFINLIICLVKTIKGFSGKSETCEVVKPLVAIAASIFTYVGILVGRVATLSISGSNKLIAFVGVQPLFMLGCAVCMVIICAILHLSRRNEKAVAKVFETIIAILSLALALFLFAFPIKFGTTDYMGLIYVSAMFLSFLDSMSDAKSFVVGVVIATVILGVALSFLTQLAQAAFGDTPSCKRRKDDYPRSLVTKSALFFAFNTLGFVVLIICLKMLYESNPEQVNFGFTAYIAIGLSVLFLGLAIANKVIRSKTDDQFVLATNEETQVQEQVVEEPAPEEPKEEVIAPVEEAPKEEVKPEPQPEPAKEEQPKYATKFCSNCGSKVEPGVKFCPNCGAKLSGGTAQPREQTSEEKIEELSQKIADELEKK